MNKIKVAVIGVGSISKHHIESYLANENVEFDGNAVRDNPTVYR